MKDLNNYTIAKEHGLHDEEYSAEHYKCLIISELMDAVKADRQNRRANLVWFFDMIERYNDFDRAFEICIKDTIEDELADACVRSINSAGEYGLPLPSFNDQFVLYEGFTFTEAIYAIISEVQQSAKAGLFAIMHYAQTLNIDIYRHIGIKMEYNKHREYRHGKCY